ncbi:MULTISPECIES: GNAT family N-acetyltransferase [Dyella]|uniref:N-acetyltransferase n=2 Tax=Dyella TaxID=231454 RepID=A0A4R0Z230_9GAMM|nr:MULTISPECIES: GNAT family N-acetyltransferase [Dyella]TBR39177.1 N-acetyltransferase [Dyella terrae]TCI13236.1 N-acetyltransferase [Dyella soli]
MSDSTAPTLRMEVPGIDEYRAMRLATGLSDKTVEAAGIGLAASWSAVCVRDQGQLIGMGRVVGDGGCFFLVVDIAVSPDWQGKGIGKRIMAALMDDLRARAPTSSIVGLFADREAWRLYAQFGFTLSAPASQGMMLRL